MMFEPLNADCGFAQRPKFAAAGIFTQIDPIVCVYTQKNIHRHKQFSKSYILTCAFPLCTIAARWLESVCACICIVVGTWATNSESMRKPGKLRISKIVHRGCAVSLSPLQRKHLKGNCGAKARNGIKEFLFHHDNYCKPCTINLYLIINSKPGLGLGFTGCIFHRLQ